MDRLGNEWHMNCLCLAVLHSLLLCFSHCLLPTGLLFGLPSAALSPCLAAYPTLGRKHLRDVHGNEEGSIKAPALQSTTTVNSVECEVPEMLWQLFSQNISITNATSLT
jgi:hypothetical protein